MQDYIDRLIDEYYGLYDLYSFYNKESKELLERMEPIITELHQNGYLCMHGRVIDL